MTHRSLKLSCFAACLFVVGMALPRSVLADFNESERSIDFTEESLPKGKIEVGFLGLYYGVTDQLMVSVPTGPLAYGLMGSEIKYKVPLSENFRITPGMDVSVNTRGLDEGFFHSKNMALKVGFGLDFGDRKQHSFSLPVGYEFSSSSHPFTGIQYGYYTLGGNFLYLGFSGSVPHVTHGVYFWPYVGYTWAWEHIQVGVVLVPIPYIHWILPFPTFSVRF